MSENNNEQNAELNLENQKIISEEGWAIKPCSMYKEEYSDCTSFKARFHQYFIHGHTIDCDNWNTDYKNCLKYEESNGNDVESGKAVILSERERRRKRLAAHNANDIWEKRESPPSDWNKPLPDWLNEKNKNSLLEIKSKELSGLTPATAESESYCVIM